MEITFAFEISIHLVERRPCAMTGLSVMMENKISGFYLFRILNVLPPFCILAFRLFFLCNVSRVSQEEVKKWAESLENLISHECKYDSFSPNLHSLG